MYRWPPGEPLLSSGAQTCEFGGYPGQEAASRIRALRLGLRDLGWNDGRNIAIDYRYGASDVGLISRYANELVGLAPDVIVGNSTPVLAALRRATSSIPIVFAAVNDPVGQGFISSLAHPETNITGFTFIDFEMIGKWVSLLNDLVPNLRRVALMFDPDTSPFFGSYLHSFKALRQPFLGEIEAAPVRNVTEIELTVAKLGRETGSGLIAPSDVFINDQRDVIINSALQHGVTIISVYRAFVVGGGLISYGPDTSDIFRRASSYVDRILKGETPANLPVQSPVIYELVINQKTAKVLGLTIPQPVMQLADEVIE